MMTATEQRKPGFLDLPPEMRNRVYELALFEGNGPVTIDATWRPPALLSTCTQIRNETLCMAYTSHEFSYTITDCESSIVVAFWQHFSSLPARFQARTNYRLVGFDWDKLIAWCRHIWKGDIFPLWEMDKPGRIWAVVYGATNIAKHAQGSWEACELQLDAYRAVVGELDGSFK